MIDWSIEAVSFGSCNCDYGCPCQFERRPSRGNCRGFEVGRIERGHFGGIVVDGLCYALLYAWPAAVYEGNGTIQAIIDERADEEQRRALATVLYGEETEEAKTHSWLYHAMSTTVHEPIFKPIEFEVDIEKRTARVPCYGFDPARGRTFGSSGRPVTVSRKGSFLPGCSAVGADGERGEA